jgi:hypothetical protein
MEKTVGLGNRMDLVFHNIRLGLFYMDHSKLNSNNNRQSNEILAFSNLGNGKSVMIGIPVDLRPVVNGPVVKWLGFRMAKTRWRPFQNCTNLSGFQMVF